MGLDDSQKIGFGLICLGLCFISFGVLLMFDSALIAIGNIMFLMGLYFSIGFSRTFALFARRDRIRGTICFFLGIALVLMRWGLIGMLLEGFGFINLFGNFLPTVLSFARQIPYLSTVLDLPVVADVLDMIAGKSLPKYSV
mmetsp:Transcript_18109/g.30267  ORF Transcript_18109/g.30267 Transcript_18109/m.30267 type:complete len:141 (-) Transcript_18109:202-624(-)